MAPREEEREKERMRPSVRDYALAAGLALLVIAVVLQMENLGLLALVPPVIGLLGLLVNSSLTPVLVLLVVTAGLALRNRLMGLPGWYEHPPSVMAELGLALALIVYVAAAFRLRTLTKYAAPQRGRRKPAAPRAAGRWSLRGAPAWRSAVAAGREVMFLLVTAFGACVLGYMAWGVLWAQPRPRWVEFPAPVWRAVLLVWAGVVLVVVVGGLFGYLKMVFAPRERGVLWLQDELWTATRGEQRRIWRWMTWARLRRERKEEGR